MKKGASMMKSISHHDPSGKTITVAILPSAWNRTWHFLVMTLITLSLLTFLSVISGCSGGGGGGGTTPTDNSDDDNDYSGSARVSGTIRLSHLSSSDSAEIESGAPVARRKGSKAVDEDNEAVKLYVVGENGELEDTGISCSIEEDENGDRAYECDGVKDGVNYIIRYLKLSGTGKALELKANAFVPEGENAPEEDADVSPQTSVIVQAIVDAILSATAGTEISDDLVNTIIDSVKGAIVNLVEAGAIQIPSMVVDVGEDTTLEDLIGEEPENNDLGNAAGMILADDTIGNELDLLTAENEAALFDLSTVDTAAEKEELIRKVFNDLVKDDKGGSNGMPDFFYNFFTWLYVSNDTVDVGDLLSTLLGSMTYSADAINTDQVTVNNIIAMFNNRIGEMHDLLALNPDTLTNEQKAALSQYPGVMRGLFPSGFGTMTADTMLITPQAIAMVIFVEKVFMPATIIPDVQAGTEGDGGQIDYSDDYFEWDDHALFEFLGLPMYVTSHLGEFIGVDIHGLNLHPGTVWIVDQDGQGTEHEALMLSTDMMDLTAFVSGGDTTITNQPGTTVTLTYPRLSGGTGTIALAYLSYGDHGYWGLEPWSEAYVIDPANPVINPARVVSDFTSGTYTLTVVIDGNTTQKSFEKSVITGMTDAYVKMITPAGMPIWPGMDATQEETDAFNNAWNAYNANGGRTNFTANVMDDGTAPGDGETATKAKLTLSWAPPAVTLPDGVKMAYSIDIGQSNCDEFGDCSWTPVWNSWDNNKRIYATAFTIPILFDVQTVDEAMNNPYHINIGVHFVDQATGEQLGSGGNAHSEFTVGEAIDPTATFTILGINAIKIEDTNVDPTHLRIAVVKETQVGAVFTRTILGINDIIGSTGYALNFEIGDFLSGNVNTWYNIVLIDDSDDSLTAGSSLDYATMTYWPDNSKENVWFETWGGILKVMKNTFTTSGENLFSMDIITGGEEIDGVSFYIGDNAYVTPDPTTVTPVPSGVLDDAFTISGYVDTTGLTNPQLVLIEEVYDDLSGFMIQSVKRIATLNVDQYAINTMVGDFYDIAGLPTNKRYYIILVDDPDSLIAVGSALPAALPMYWPDWANGNFGFDTWRGGELYIIQDIYDSGSGTWTYSDWAVPSETIAVDGPYIATMY